MTRNPRRALAAWILYDAGYGAFTTIVTTFVVPAYFTQAVAAHPAGGAAQWAAAQASAGIVIALLAIPLGAMADRHGRRRLPLALATLVMTIATALLWLVKPHAGDALLALALVGTATIAFETALVFYNAMLPDLVPPERLGRVSMLAWGAGYAGGLTALGLCLGLLVLPRNPPFGLDRATAEPVRACALLAAAWIAAFAWPVLAFGPATPPPRAHPAASTGDIRRLLARCRAEARLGRFVLARLLFMDGLVTLFAFGGIYAAGAFGFTPQGILVFGIGLTATAGAGVLAGALIEDTLGSRETILLSLAGLLCVGLLLLLVRDKRLFWVLGLSLGLFVGPAQAASRSLMARLAPPGERAAYFGLLALSGRVTAFVGPLALSAVTAATDSLRAGMAVILAFLAGGFVVLLTTPKSRPGAPGAPPTPARRAAAPTPEAG